MSWYVHPSKQLRDDELPPELVVTNSNGSIEQVYVPERTTEAVSLRERDHAEYTEDAYVCKECGTHLSSWLVKPWQRYCPMCGRRIVKK